LLIFTDIDGFTLFRSLFLWNRLYSLEEGPLYQIMELGIRGASLELDTYEIGTHQNGRCCVRIVDEVQENLLDSMEISLEL
jgi:hypothetical protein